MKQRKIVANLLLAGFGLLAAGSLLGSSTDVTVSQDNTLVKTSKTFNGFKVDIGAPASVDGQQLLNAIPEGLKYSEDVFDKVSTAVDKIRAKAYPDETISLDVSRLGDKTTNKATSDYVNLYKANYWWNRTAGFNGQVYGYNYYRNTVACFVRAQYGSWYGQYQSSGTWYNQGYVYAGGLQTMYVTGSDSYKGCNWWGKSSANKGDFIMYVFD